MTISVFNYTGINIALINTAVIDKHFVQFCSNSIKRFNILELNLTTNLKTLKFEKILDKLFYLLMTQIYIKQEKYGNSTSF